MLSCLAISLVALIGLGIGGWYALQWGIGFAQRNVLDPAQQTLIDVNQPVKYLADTVPTGLALEELINTVPTSLAEIAEALPSIAATPVAEAGDTGRGAGGYRSL